MGRKTENATPRGGIHRGGSHGGGTHGGPITGGAHDPAPEAAADLWKPARVGTLSEDVIRQIREALFSDHLRPGDYLGSEGSLSERFGVSRIVVRDALRSLQASGIVEIRKGAGGGVRISRANPHILAEAFAIQLKLLAAPLADVVDAQITIEASTAELAALRASPQHIQHLHTCLDLAQAQSDPYAFTAAIRDFHICLAEASGSLVLTTFLRGVMQVMATTYGPNTTPERAQGVLDKYRNVVDAISARDPESARLHMLTHLRKVKANLMADGILAP